jgi:hypothetical protein
MTILATENDVRFPPPGTSALEKPRPKTLLVAVVHCIPDVSALILVLITTIDH